MVCGHRVSSIMCSVTSLVSRREGLPYCSYTHTNEQVSWCYGERGKCVGFLSIFNRVTTLWSPTQEETTCDYSFLTAFFCRSRLYTAVRARVPLYSRETASLNSITRFMLTVYARRLAIWETPSFKLGSDLLLLIPTFIHLKLFYGGASANDVIETTS